MTENGETKVRFSLWVVLAFIVLLGAAVSGYLLDCQAKDREKQQVIKQEVVVLQEQFKNIDDKLNKLVTNSETIKEAFITHRIKTERKDNAK
jgi:hypothetical protein